MKLLAWTTLLTLSLTLTACAPATSTITNQPDIAVDIISTSPATVSRADAYLKDGQLVVAGTVRRMHEMKRPGHVDILVRGSNGLEEIKSVTVRGLSSKKRGALNRPFHAVFNLEQMTVSKVIVTYHDRSGSQEGHNTGS